MNLQCFNLLSKQHKSKRSGGYRLAFLDAKNETKKMGGRKIREEKRQGKRRGEGGAGKCDGVAVAARLPPLGPTLPYKSSHPGQQVKTCYCEAPQVAGVSGVALVAKRR